MTTHCGDDGRISKTHDCTWRAAGERLASGWRADSGWRAAGRQEAGEWLASWGEMASGAGKWRASGWPTTGEQLASGWQAAGERPKRAAVERLASSWRVAGEQLPPSAGNCKARQQASEAWLQAADKQLASSWRAAGEAAAGERLASGCAPPPPPPVTPLHHRHTCCPPSWSARARADKRKAPWVGEGGPKEKISSNGVQGNERALCGSPGAAEVASARTTLQPGPTRTYADACDAVRSKRRRARTRRPLRHAWGSYRHHIVHT